MNKVRKKFLFNVFGGVIVVLWLFMIGLLVKNIEYPESDGRSDLVDKTSGIINPSSDWMEIYLKDEKGLFDRDPKKVGHEERKKLKFYDRISAGELLAADLDDLIIERPILAMLQRAKCIRQLQIIDALHNPGDILRALEGEAVGTIITKG